MQVPNARWSVDKIITEVLEDIDLKEYIKSNVSDKL